MGYTICDSVGNPKPLRLIWQVGDIGNPGELGELIFLTSLPVTPKDVGRLADYAESVA